MPTQEQLALTAAAASVEAFYRSACSSIANWQLTGVRASLFPAMHIQIPARVVYICGFKASGGLHWLPRPFEESWPTVAQAVAWCAPGVLMAPVASIIVACNAGHANPEPLYAAGPLAPGVRGR